MSAIAKGASAAALLAALIALQAVLSSAPIGVPDPGDAGVTAYSLEAVGPAAENLVELEVVGPAAADGRTPQLEMIRPYAAPVGRVTAVTPAKALERTPRRRMRVRLKVYPGVWKLRFGDGMPFGAVHVREDRVPDL